MKRVRIRFLLSLLVGGMMLFPTMGADTPGEFPRTWTNAQGRTVQATYVGDEKDLVLLKLGTGQVSKVPAASLSKADQEHLVFARARTQLPPAQIPQPVLIQTCAGILDASQFDACDAGSFVVEISRYGHAPEPADQRGAFLRPLMGGAWFLQNLPGLPAPETVPADERPRVICAADDQYASVGGVAGSEWTISRDGHLILPWKLVERKKDGASGDPRLPTLLPAMVEVEVANDTIFLPPWVRHGVLECARIVPQEQGWPQPARLVRAVVDHLATMGRFGEIKPDMTLLREALDLPIEEWDKLSAEPEKRNRYATGALMLVYYYMFLDPYALSAWKDAWALAHAEGSKVREFHAGVARYRTGIKKYLADNHIAVGADGSFQYPSNNPPPKVPDFPFEELKTKDYATLSKKHTAVLERAFGRDSAEKTIAEAYARAGIPLGTNTPAAPTTPAVASTGNGTIVNSAKRLPVDNRPWPLQIKVGLDAVIAYEVKDASGKPTNRYRCGRFEFKSNEPLSLPVVQELARTFTAVEQLIKQLPWGITPKPGNGAEFFQARLFSTREAYERDGGPALSGGVYSRNDKIFRVPFQSLGIALKNGQYVKSPGFNVTALVHELTHMMMDEMLLCMPIWAVEGSAEYTEMIPFKDGLFRFGDHQEGIKAYAAKFAAKSTQPTAEECVQVMHLTEKAWHASVASGKLGGSGKMTSTTPGPGVPPGEGPVFVTMPATITPEQINTQHRLYCAATLLYYYFMHLDEPKRGHPMLPFMDAVQDELSKMRDFTAAESNYRRLMDEFLKQPGVKVLGGGRFSYPSNLQPPSPPALPGGVGDAGQLGFIHLDKLTKGRNDAQLAEEIRKKYAAIGIKL